ncbi:hypothetical protein NLU13_4695 [Sarocladium strictum]|uniref:Uncharacterized protein n=1 Tax=Sarocladium strictum TaxID=5046 RepID=A0AA39GK06_SARSR|nr:hypothetical protein NLU13_4695 [Sarocladium strictum]
MRFSLAVLAAVASTATALPILDTINSLVGGGNNVANEAGSVVHVVWTNIKAGNIVSLSVLDAAAENVLAHTCGDELVGGAFKAMPINFSQVTPEGLGSFLINDSQYLVSDVLQGGAGGVQCVQKNIPDAAVLDCVVPVVAGLVLPIVSEVSEIVTCLTSGLPLIGNLPVLSSLPL